LPDIEVDFQKLQREMFDLLIREDPIEAKRLGLIGVHNSTNIFGQA
jgi:molybdate-binding protein